MATTLYLTNQVSSLQAVANTEYVASATRGTGVQTATAASTVGQQDPIVDGSGAIYWYSEPLEEVTISGTITINLRMAESSMSADQYACISVHYVNAAGTVVTTIIEPTQNGFGFSGSELGTTESARNWATLPSNNANIASGGRLRFTVNTSIAQGVGNTGYTTTLWYNGTTSAASGDSFITFTETLLPLRPTPPIRTRLQAVKRAGSF